MESPQAMPKNVQIGCLDTTFAISYSYNIKSTKKKYRCSNLCKAKRNFQGKKSEELGKNCLAKVSIRILN